MDNKIDTLVPVLFQKLKTYEDESEDTRFLKVKIWLMHTEENLNGSYFSKESVEAAIPTLANTPILAYIEDNSEGEEDFSDHRMILVKEDGKFKVKYVGQAIGLIPENNDAQFESRVCDDGIEREFLTVTGYVWTKFDSPIDIFNRDEIKSQSMELHDNYQGEWKDDGLFHFTKFSFYGACALGNDVLPAMRSATIEAQFSQDKLFEEINSKMEKFKLTYSEFEKGGNAKVDEKLELLAKYSLTEEDLAEKGIVLADFSVEELEAKLIELKEPEQEFTLTGEQFVSELVNELRKEKIKDDWDWEYSRYSYVDYKENEVFAYDWTENYTLYGFTFSADGDKITIDFDSKKRKKFEIVDFDEGTSGEFSVIPKDALEYEVKVAEKKIEDKFGKEQETLKEQFSKLEQDAEELRQFKAGKLQEERTEKESALFDSFSNELTEEDVKDLKETASEFSLEQLEEKLFTLVGKKKANFTKQPKREKQTSVKIEVENTSTEEPAPYGGLLEKFSK
ncbi:hypothetical protein [Bacillus sp. UMB0728]|uniref:hypothetical protein n=1 Tax=Bacillus sp. UMB0728 TaxID=2066052 RepID=UPI000C769F90|nr:hypothetical protein [Bacillus sp. UMB0728]PLR72308.1 hypothetical protein CYJ37_12185 [Bacillus sp. UMB0728]